MNLLNIMGIKLVKYYVIVSYKVVVNWNFGLKEL